MALVEKQVAAKLHLLDLALDYQSATETWDCPCALFENNASSRADELEEELTVLRPLPPPLPQRGVTWPVASVATPVPSTADTATYQYECVAIDARQSCVHPCSERGGWRQRTPMTAVDSAGSSRHRPIRDGVQRRGSGGVGHPIATRRKGGGRRRLIDRRGGDAPLCPPARLTAASSSVGRGQPHGREGSAARQPRELVAPRLRRATPRVLSALSLSAPITAIPHHSRFPPRPFPADGRQGVQSPQPPRSTFAPAWCLTPAAAPLGGCPTDPKGHLSRVGLRIAALVAVVGRREGLRENADWGGTTDPQAVPQFGDHVWWRARTGRPTTPIAVQSGCPDARWATVHKPVVPSPRRRGCHARDA